MHGNVLEWVQDEWHGNYNGAPTDGSAWEYAGPDLSWMRRWVASLTGAALVCRGGPWNYDPRGCRSASRYDFVPDIRYVNTGFRCARVQVVS